MATTTKGSEANAPLSPFSLPANYPTFVHWFHENPVGDDVLHQSVIDVTDPQNHSVVDPEAFDR